MTTQFTIPKRSNYASHIVIDSWSLCGGGVDGALADQPSGDRVCDRCALHYSGWVVYRYFDAAGRLLYVGCTGDALSRMLAHSTSQSWWSQVRSYRHEEYSDFRAAAAEELRAIRTESPLHNKMCYRSHPLGDAA